MGKLTQCFTHWVTAIWAWLNALIPFGQSVYTQESSVKSKCCYPIPDGCTGVPDFDFKDVCDRHDLDYATGGSKADRLRADQALRQGIIDRGHPILARIYFVGVRVLGKRAFCFHEPGLSLCDAGDFQYARSLESYADNLPSAVDAVG